MDKQAIQKLIREDHLEQAIQQMLEEGYPGEREISQLSGRLKGLNLQQDQGTLSSSEYNQERNKIRLALLNTLNKPQLPPGFQTSNRMRIILLSAVVLVAAIAGLLSLFQKKDTFTPDQINTIQQNLSAQRIDLVRTAVSFETTQQYKVGLAYLKRKYAWTADMPFFIDTKDIKLDYLPETKQLSLSASKIQLLDNFIVKNQRAETIENSLWVEEKSMDGDFWADINKTTGLLADVKLANDPELRAQFFKIATDKLKNQILAQPNTADLSIKINLNTLELVSGQQIQL